MGVSFLNHTPTRPDFFAARTAGSRFRSLLNRVKHRIAVRLFKMLTKTDTKLDTPSN